MLNSDLRLFGKTCKFLPMHDALNKAEVVHPRSSFPRNGLWSQGLRVSWPLGSRLYLKALGRLCCVPAGSDAAPKYWFHFTLKGSGIVSQLSQTSNSRTACIYVLLLVAQALGASHRSIITDM